MKKLGIVLGLLTLCVFAFAAGEGSGQAGAYLRMGVGARALGMGGAFVAVSDDATASYWNPAGLAKLKKNQASFMHARLKMDRNFDFINYVKKNETKNEAYGFAMVRFGVDNIPETRVWRFNGGGALASDQIYGTPIYYYDTATGTAKAIPVTSTGTWADGSAPAVPVGYSTSWSREQVEAVYQADPTTTAVYTDVNVGYNPAADPVKIFSNFDDSENAYYFSYSKAFDRLYFGANMKYMTQSLYNADANSIGLDLGLLYDYSSKVSFGFSVRNLMNELKWDTPSGRKDKVPVDTTLGVAYVPEPTWLVAMDYNKVENMDAELYLGVEKWFNDIFAFRLGSHDGDLSAGMSFVRGEWSFEYAFAEQELGDIHRFSTTKKFDF